MSQHLYHAYSIETYSLAYCLHTNNDQNYKE